MIKKLLLIPFVIGISFPVSAQEIYRINVNRLCATIVDIPYASDNFTDEEWQQFTECVNFMKQFQE